MCGIAGIVSNKNQNKIRTVKMMVNALKHRGPDSSGYCTFDSLHMGMRRLSIIDVDGGNQPLSNEDNSITIIGNGEVYNFIELNQKLQKLGHQFQSKSDMETIIHAYEQWGPKFVHKLRGMYAFALYDSPNKTLLLVRDRLGEKPLYYSQTNNGICFSSEVKSLLKCPDISKELNFQSIDDYLHYYYIPEPETMFKEVKKLPSGSMMVIDTKTNEFRIQKYWDSKDIPASNNSNPTLRIKRTFRKACQLTLRSDVPVGIALSGGIDSGAILAFSAPLYKDRMKAFSVGYKSTPQSDERANARKLASEHNVEFIDVEINSKEAVSNFPELVWYSDDPIADIASHAIYSVYKAAHNNGIKVILGGIGGDELFWGYPSTQESAKKNNNDKTTNNYKNPDPKNNHGKIRNLYTSKMKEQIPRESHLRFFRICTGDTNLEIAKKTLDSLHDLWLRGNCIPLNDRLSMAVSVELRSPFLDYKLVETALSSIKNVNSYNKDQKYWFKKAMKGTLPKEVLSREKKGFTPPVADWLWGITNNYSHLLWNGFLVKEKIISRYSALSITLRRTPGNLYFLYQLILLEIWGREYVYGQTPKEIVQSKGLI